MPALPKGSPGHGAISGRDRGCSPVVRMTPSALSDECSVLSGTACFAMDSSVIDRYIRAEIERNDIPGASVAISRNGEIIYAAGFGVRSVVTGDPMTADTPGRSGIGKQTLDGLCSEATQPATQRRSRCAGHQVSAGTWSNRPMIEFRNKSMPRPCAEGSSSGKETQQRVIGVNSSSLSC